MIKVNFNVPFKDVFGNPVLENGKPLIVGKHLGFNLYNVSEIDGKPLSPEEKFNSYSLAVKIANADKEIELSRDEATLIDKVASQVFSAGAYANVKFLIKKNKS